MTKQINTGIEELLLLLLPEGVTECLPRWIEGKDVLQQFRIAVYGGTIDIELPDGNWEELGIAHELTEEVWSTLVVEHPLTVSGYVDYMDFFWKTTECCNHFNTATESGLSLLRANEVFNKNPYGIDPYGLVSPVCGETCSCVVGCYQAANYDDAQQNTGKWILLRKL